MLRKLKPIFGVFASGAAGFYLGGRWVGQIATPENIIQAPEWVSTVHSVLFWALVVMVLGVAGWLYADFIDYLKEQDSAE